MASSRPAADVRLYKQRASYSLRAAIDILNESLIAHVAFVHPGDVAADGKQQRKETLMNLPLIVAVVCGGEDEDDPESYAVYLHSHKHSGLVEAVQKGSGILTATATKIDGMVLSPTPQDHSLNYRSATFHLHQSVILDDEKDHEEKRAALVAITDIVTGYDRGTYVGLPPDSNVKGLAIIRCRISALSCKQRHGAFSSAQEPVTEVIPGEEGNAFKGVIPCWTQWGSLEGFGHDREVVEKVFEERSIEGKAFAEKSAWAHEDAAIQGLGKRRKPVTRLP